MKTKELVQEIHDAFNGASDKLLIESQETIKNLESQITTHEEEDVANRMRKLGFNQTGVSKRVRRHEEGQAAVKKIKQELEDEARLVVEKARIDPIHKFITERQVRFICEKYGLLHGPAGNYTGDIPMKNLKEIEEFKVRDVDVKYIVSVCFLDGYVAHWDKDKHKKVHKEKCHIKHQGRIGSDVRYEYYYLSISRAKKLGVYEKRDDGESHFSICAPSKDFDKEGMEVDGYKLKNKPVPDPVVLCEVHKGYRIVTAWGPEASDPNVINPLSN